ncbi:MAG: hypothetical protein IJ711_02830 [Lachnospiraceae bacterium]|nr:hypothetical protein [Lachnospiraceae bacterium]
MGRYEPCYLKAVVIVHGKSEKQICDYIKSNLRLKMDVVSDKKGEKSIQITSLKHTLNNSVFGTFKGFTEYYSDLQIVTDEKKKQIASDFKIFIIMDTDDCTEKQKEAFINREMFKKHWAYEYIVPIYHTPNLEAVLIKANIPFERRGKERKKEYIRIFPTAKKYASRESVELRTFCDELKKIKETNMDVFIEFCLMC